MPTVQKSLRIQRKSLKEIEEIAKEAGKEFSTIANELLEEAVKARRFPDIVFSEGTIGRRARIAGTGIEVWEIIATNNSIGNDFNRLRKAYHWLTERQLRSSLGYYRAYSEEIDHLIKQNEQLTKEQVYKIHPVLSRGGR